MNENKRLEFFFKTFERVLVRKTDIGPGAYWNPNIYLYTSEGMHRLLRGPDTHKTHCEIIPYEGNEHLVGTIGTPIEPWEPKPGELVAAFDVPERVHALTFHRHVKVDGRHYYYTKEPWQRIETSWGFCEPLRNHFNVPKE